MPYFSRINYSTIRTFLSNTSIGALAFGTGYYFSRGSVHSDTVNTVAGLNDNVAYRDVLREVQSRTAQSYASSHLRDIVHADPLLQHGGLFSSIRSIPIESGIPRYDTISLSK